jgi:hypothetical protein
MTQLLKITETTGPIACNMTAASDTLRERFAEYGRLFAHALVARARTPVGVELSFAAKPGVAEWVVDLARREAACCSFCSYDVQREGDRIVWRTSSQAGPDVQALLDSFYALPEQVGESVDGYFERLATSGLRVHSPQPGRFEFARAAPAKGGCGC